MTGKATLALVAAAILAALTGCSAEFSVGGDSDAPGEAIADQVSDEYAEETGIELKQLTCEGVEEETGAKFECSGRNARSVQIQIAGRVTDASGPGFDYRWYVAEAVAPGVLFERALRRQIEDGGVTLSEVRCPVEIEIEVGERLRCKATDSAGETRGVTLRLTDLDGGFDYVVEGDEAPAGASSS